MRLHSTISWLLVAVCAGSLSLACAVGAEDSDWEALADSEDVASVSPEIIGGSAVSVAIRRAQGLVNVNNGCSGSLFRQDWVLTATHCLNLATPNANTFGIPREDGTIETRTGAVIVQAGTSDITVVQLAGAPSATWPNVSRAMASGNPNNLVGTNVTCFGRGATGYANPGPGLVGGGQWRTLTRTPSSFDGSSLIVPSQSGNNTTAPGDSGGPCFVSNQTAAVVSWGWWTCADDTTDATCRSTITSVNGSGWRVTSDFAPYLNVVSDQPHTTFRPMTLVNDWIDGPFATTYAGAALVDGIVQLRGAISGGSSAQAFTLPAGFRPSHNTYVPVNLCNAKKGRLHIQPNGNVSVGAENNAFGEAQCFTSLEGVSFALNTSGFTSLSLLNGWTHSPFSTRPARARVSGQIVQLQGAIASGNSAHVFTLPAGFRPSHDAYVTVDLCNARKGRLHIQPNGNVSVGAENNAFSEAQCFTSLEGVSFALSSSGSTSLSPLNGWTHSPFGTGPTRVRNVGGIVRFQGAIATSGTNMHALTLPASLRPATDVYVPIDLCSARKGRLFIQPNGQVRVQHEGVVGDAQCFSSLEGASFGL